MSMEFSETPEGIEFCIRYNDSSDAKEDLEAFKSDVEKASSRKVQNAMMNDTAKQYGKEKPSELPEQAKENVREAIHNSKQAIKDATSANELLTKEAVTDGGVILDKQKVSQVKDKVRDAQDSLGSAQIAYSRAMIEDTPVKDSYDRGVIDVIQKSNVIPYLLSPRKTIDNTDDDGTIKNSTMNVKQDFNNYKRTTKAYRENASKDIFNYFNNLREVGLQ